MADARLQAVYDAASFLFVKQGYERTQVSEIAAQAGVATGTMYNLFSGKKAILHFVLLCTFDKDYLRGDVELPVQEVETSRLINHLHRVAGELLEKLEHRAATGEPSLTFSETLTLTFDYAANYQVAFNTINDNRVVLKEVRQVYQQYVGRLYAIIEENFSLAISRGEVRQVELPSLHIRNIIDHLIWWAMYLPYQVQDVKLDPTQAKQIALDVLRHAYLVKPKE
jgi:AcrR family transcriptional regulator